mmetsp:Transcript_7489/g.18731  ORF Transcript_7489/g.18731 Transcript_7489/m.18731 type:complete len:1119 (-) Transcript_7489:136-3492(-)
MSFPGGKIPDHLDNDVERRIQEELRRHQNKSMAEYMSLMAADGNGAYYGAAAAAAHQRAAYGGLGQQAAAFGMDSASMYARQQQQHAHHAAAAAAYGYAPRGSASHYGYGHGHHAPTASDIYSQQMAMANIEQRAAAAYGQHQQAAAHQQLMAAASPQGKPPPSTSSSVTSPTGTTVPSMENTPLQTHLQASPSVSEMGSAPKSSPSSLSGIGPMAIPSTPMTTTSSLTSPRSTSTKKKKKKEPLETVDLDDLKIEKWYSGCVPLGLDDDKYWLSELQVYLRAHFAEAFGATEEDIAAPMHGRNKPIALGQVGIRCMHCKHENPAERGQQATSYPSLISGIYNSVQQMLRLHLDCCQAMPPEIRSKIESLKVSSSSRGGRKQYWIDSAKRLGLVDTRHGIHFGRDPLGPLPPLTGPSVNSKEGRKKKEAQKKAEPTPPPPEEEEQEPPPPVDDRPLVFPEDQDLISDYLYLTLEQMSPCVLMEADRVGCYKGRKVGFPGLACKHCVGQAGCGRYFPASEASLSQTTTSQTIMNHVRNCRRCPMEIRENLELMKRARMGPDGKRLDKPKHGGRKVFFRRLWCRIQGLPLDEASEGKGKKKRYRKPGVKPKKKKKSAEEDNGIYSDGEDEEVKETVKAAPKKSSASSGEETETESSEAESEEDEGGKASTRGKSTAKGKKKQSPWFDGCVRLTKHDDSNWLSELQCFARSDLVEVFSWKGKDSPAGYSGRKDPYSGQVGIRCVFCKNLSDSKKPSGCVVFPESLEAIPTKVGELLRLHFKSCPSIPEDKKEAFKSLKNFGPKVDESGQYWIDSARDIGLSDIPPSSTGWGITFRRDPLQPSPCDELDQESETGDAPNLSKLYLIKPEDRGSCTDQVLLMMRQVKVCQFQQSDRRGGPGSRGRDRVADYPGLACKHCANKNNIGRYFPVSAKNLTDNTVNSMLSHIATCRRCPATIRASIAYLSHRAIYQKTELSGSWKKAFFKKIWDRLHVERAWVDVIKEDPEDGASATGEDSEDPEDDGDDSDDGESEGSDDRSENDEEVGDNMNALIKAAAIWLTEQDQSKETGGSSSKGGGRGRSLPSKRSSNTTSPGSRGKSSGSDDGNSRGGSLTSGKRRRVHF